jgi:hypothetical protein
MKTMFEHEQADACLLGRANPYGRSFPSPRSYGERVRVIGANLRSSLPGLTRQSIDLRKNFLAKKMDARVKPAHDELAKQLKLAPMGSSPRMTRRGLVQFERNSL